MTQIPPLALCAALPLLLAACGDPQADYPALMPTDALLAEPALPDAAADAAAAPEATTAATEARADALRARAEALRGPVIDPATRRRMEAAQE